MATIKEWKHTNGYEVGETLPSVSASDNGKVLGVSDGAWGVVAGGGGGGSELPVPTLENIGMSFGAVFDENGTPQTDIFVPEQDITITDAPAEAQNVSVNFNFDPTTEGLTYSILVNGVPHEAIFGQGTFKYLDPDDEYNVYKFEPDFDNAGFLFSYESDHGAIIPGTYNVGLTCTHPPITYGFYSY